MNVVTSECYYLDDGKWKASRENLHAARKSHAASNFGKNNIWVTGGYNELRLASTEIIHFNGEISPGPKLQEARA